MKKNVCLEDVLNKYSNMVSWKDFYFLLCVCFHLGVFPRILISTEFAFTYLCSIFNACRFTETRCKSLVSEPEADNAEEQLHKNIRKESSEERTINWTPDSRITEGRVQKGLKETWLRESKHMETVGEYIE